MTEDLSILSRAGVAPDLTLTYGDDADQVADIRYGSRGSDLPLLVFIHGGFWKPEYDRVHAQAMSSALAQAGWTTLTLEYRRISGQPDVSLQDVKTALTVLPKQLKQHSGRVILIGHSAGGHLVLWAASQTSAIELQGVLALAPAADLQMAYAMELGEKAVERFLGVDPIHRPDVNPMHLAAPKTKVTAIQGAADEIVPPAVTLSYCTAFPNTRLVSLADCGHFALIDPQSSAWASVVEEISAFK